MARVSQGNSLSTVMLQPGAKFSDDGYGLITGTCVFKADQTASIGGTITRGSSCPIATFNYCTTHKYSVSLDNLGIATYTVDYVGIYPSFGTMTDPQITGSQGLTSENITAHPNFYVLYTTGGFSGDPIAGVNGPGMSGGVISAPKYAPKTVNNTTEYEGNNGSRFETQTGGKFLGFKVAQYKTLYGKTNYLAPTSSITGHFYTSSSSAITNLREAVGKTSGTGTFATSYDLLPAYLGTSFAVGGKNQLLLAQVSFEDFGNLYKMQYEIRYNRDGYETSVYAAS
jgi:hypothetical protein